MKAILVLIFLANVLAEQHRKIPMNGETVMLACVMHDHADVKVITLSRSKYTSARRSSPIPQLTCVSGCSEYTPDTVSCTNLGSDGIDAQWRCDANLPSGLRFGRVEVSCEGFDYPEDPFILAGSCGLEYSLEGHRTDRDRNYNNYDHNNYDHYNSYTRPASRSSFGGTVFMICVCAVIFYFVYKSCATTDRDNGGGGAGQPPGGFPPRAQAPPPYDQGTTGYSSYSSGLGYGAPGYGGVNQAGGPGFWSGLAGGALAGYLMGNRRPNAYGGYMAPSYRPFSTHSGASFGGGSVSQSGFGGTRRR